MSKEHYATDVAGIEGSSRINLRNMGAIAGAIGMVLWISAPLTWLLTAEVGSLLLTKMVLGTLGLGFYLFTNAKILRDFIGSRSTGIFALSLGSTTLVFVLVIGANMLASRHPMEWDMTREGIYTLSPQTLELLKRLKSPVNIQAFYPSYDHSYRTVSEMLGRYQRSGQNNVVYSIIDPQMRPDLVEKYQISEQGPRIVVSQGQQDARVKDLTEQELTHAIMKVAEHAPKKVYVLAGHGEGNVQAAGAQAEGFKQLNDAILADGYELAQLNLQTGQVQNMGSKVKIGSESKSRVGTLKIPQDAAALLVIGPKHALMQPEAEAIRRYVDDGGRLGVFLEPHQQTGLESLLRAYRIEANNDMIVDPNPLGRLLGLGAAAPVVQPASEDHPIVKNMSAPGIMHTARSLQVVEGDSMVETTILARTGESAWGETDLREDGTAAHDARDIDPPLSVAIAASQTHDVPVSDGKAEQAKTKVAKSRIVVFGDSDWLSNRYLNMQGNQDLALNALGWLVEQEEKITVRPKARAASMLYLSNSDLGKLKFFSMDVIPVLMVAMGLGVVLIRRQR
jgi:ABC-type uncharacterized transport system involved in gliding motility auxiliary subunit